jgi:hypothetical protein
MPSVHFSAPGWAWTNGFWTEALAPVAFISSRYRGASLWIRQRSLAGCMPKGIDRGAITDEQSTCTYEPGATGEGGLTRSDDFFVAALVFQHGKTLDDFQ